MVVPDALVRRLRGVPGDRVAAEGMAACAETVAALRELPGVAGVHVMSVGYEQGVPEILAAAGLQPLTPNLTAPAAPDHEGGTALPNRTPPSSRATAPAIGGRLGRPGRSPAAGPAVG